MADKHRDDSHRIAISTFIIATVFTLLQFDIPVPQSLSLPLTFFLIGLISSAVFAFMYILAKGYELRHKKKANNFVDKYNYILYDTALKAYMFVSFILGGIYVLGLLAEAGKAGNLSAQIAAWFAVPIIAVIMNYSDFKDLFDTLYRRIKR